MMLSRNWIIVGILVLPFIPFYGVLVLMSPNIRTWAHVTNDKVCLIGLDTCYCNTTITYDTNINRTIIDNYIWQVGEGTSVECGIEDTIVTIYYNWVKISNWSYSWMGPWWLGFSMVMVTPFLLLVLFGLWQQAATAARDAIVEVIGSRASIDENEWDKVAVGFPGPVIIINPAS